MMRSPSAWFPAVETPRRLSIARFAHSRLWPEASLDHGGGHRTMARSPLRGDLLAQDVDERLDQRPRVERQVLRPGGPLEPHRLLAVGDDHGTDVLGADVVEVHQVAPPRLESVPPGPLPVELPHRHEAGPRRSSNLFPGGVDSDGVQLPLPGLLEVALRNSPVPDRLR
jgi:hypothetical protein